VKLIVTSALDLAEHEFMRRHAQTAPPLYLVE